MTPEIIYEDKNFLAVNKPAGLLVHGVRTAQGKRQTANDQTLVEWLLKRYPEIQTVGDPSASSGQVNSRPGIVHRLDRDTSGIMLVARTQESFEYLKSLFMSREIKKTYLAVVEGRVEQKTGRIEKPISLKSHTTKRTVHRGVMEKEAITEYRVLKHIERSNGESETGTVFSILEVRPLTGRTHQIRVHLASIGHPVVGDRLYGCRGRQPITDNQQRATRLMLHALSVEFTTVDGKRIKIEAEPPDGFDL